MRASVVVVGLGLLVSASVLALEPSSGTPRRGMCGEDLSSGNIAGPNASARRGTGECGQVYCTYSCDSGPTPGNTWNCDPGCAPGCGFFGFFCGPECVTVLCSSADQ